MARFLSGLAVLSSFIVLTACVTESGTFRRKGWTKDAVPGQTILLSESGDVAADCRTAAVPTVRIASGPSQGSTQIRQERVYPQLPAGHAYRRCNSTKITGVAVYYTAQKGYRGTDEVKILVAFAAGYVDELTVRIKVH